MFSFLQSHLRSPVLPEMGTHFLCGCKELLQTGHGVGQGFHVSPDFSCHPMFKAIPGQASALFTSQGSVLCLGLWKFQMCQYFINFLISDPNECVVLEVVPYSFFPLLHCYNFSCNKRTTWKISATYSLFFLVECI